MNATIAARIKSLEAAAHHIAKGRAEVEAVENIIAAIVKNAKADNNVTKTVIEAILAEKNAPAMLRLVAAAEAVDAGL